MLSSFVSSHYPPLCFQSSLLCSLLEKLGTMLCDIFISLYLLVQIGFVDVCLWGRFLYSGRWKQNGDLVGAVPGFGQELHTCYSSSYVPNCLWRVLISCNEGIPKRWRKIKGKVLYKSPNEQTYACVSHWKKSQNL